MATAPTKWHEAGELLDWADAEHGVAGQRLDIPGGYTTADGVAQDGTTYSGRAVEGVFEFIKESDGSISHRFFRMTRGQ